MVITLNGKPLQITPVNNLQDFLDALETENTAAIPPKQFAVALNSEFVPNSLYASSPLSDGDVVELLIPMQGG